MNKRQTFKSSATTYSDGFTLKFRKRLTMSSGNLRVKQILEQFKTVKSSHFTFDKKWMQLHSLYTGLDENKLLINTNFGLISKAIDICLLVLDEIGRRFEEDEYYTYYDDSCSIDNVCLEIAGVLTEIMGSPDMKESMKQRTIRKLKEIARYSSFTDYGYFEMDEFIENGGIFDDSL